MKENSTKVYIKQINPEGNVALKEVRQKNKSEYGVMSIVNDTL